MGGRGSSSGKGKGSRTLKRIFRKNTANSVERLVNRQTEELNKLRALERGRSVAEGKARTGFEKAQIRRDYNKRIESQRATVNATQREIEDAIRKQRR